MPLIFTSSLGSFVVALLHLLKGSKLQVGQVQQLKMVGRRLVDWLDLVKAFFRDRIRLH